MSLFYFVLGQSIVAEGVTMNPAEINQVLDAQRKYFNTGATLPVSFRIAMLKKLYDIVQGHKEEILAALTADLGKSDYEGFMCEVGLSLTEISYMMTHVKKFTKEQVVKTPLAQFASRSYKKSVPYGNVLIMSPWNYPFLLTIEPLANAIAAGNTVIVKPSAYSPATSSLIAQLIEKNFPPEYVAVVTGGRQENATLLQQKFDMIFFTGSQSVGKEVLRAAAEHLTPAVLELGGKSPCIVDETAKIKLAAKRIVFGKYLNCGQTCVAPDFILCHSSVKDKFVTAVKDEIKAQYGAAPLNNPDYGKIINEKHFQRVRGLIQQEKVVVGGSVNEATCQIEPTVMDRVTWEDPVMQEEIFGPIMPILTYDNLDHVINKLQNWPKPLAFYIFSENKKER
jgi:aldehyde dehydrogenase (NAD+)